jgi:hypothetical protein
VGEVVGQKKDKVHLRVRRETTQAQLKARVLRIIQTTPTFAGRQTLMEDPLLRAANAGHTAWLRPAALLYFFGEFTL